MDAERSGIQNNSFQRAFREWTLDRRFRAMMMSTHGGERRLPLFSRSTKQRKFRTLHAHLSTLHDAIVRHTARTAAARHRVAHAEVVNGGSTRVLGNSQNCAANRAVVSGAWPVELGDASQHDAQVIFAFRVCFVDELYAIQRESFFAKGDL